MLKFQEKKCFKSSDPHPKVTGVEKKEEKKEEEKMSICWPTLLQGAWVKHFYDHCWELEAMRGLHILSDPVTDFWKCPKKVLKKIIFFFFHFLPRGGV